MCLCTLWSKEKQKEWLEKQPDNIVGYKVVEIEKDNIYPCCYVNRHNHGKFSPTKNKIAETTEEMKNVKTMNGLNYYTAYYHVFKTRKAALAWKTAHDTILKCIVPKKSITNIGTQNDFIVVITKAFEFLKR